MLFRSFYFCENDSCQVVASHHPEMYFRTSVMVGFSKRSAVAELKITLHARQDKIAGDNAITSAPRVIFTDHKDDSLSRQSKVCCCTQKVSGINMSIKLNTTTLVDLGSYKLEVTINGPPRRAHNPIVIILPDIGSSIKEWTAVTEILAGSMSVVNYERAGYGQSEPIPSGKPRSPVALAEELHLLRRAAKIAPP